MDKLFILGQQRVIAHRDILAVWLCLFQHYEECLSMDRGLTPPSPCYDLNAYEIITLSITILYIHQIPRITYFIHAKNKHNYFLPQNTIFLCLPLQTEPSLAWC